MKNIFFISIALAWMGLVFTGCSGNSGKPLAINFEASKSVPGTKIAFTKFDKKFPTDWSGYRYLVFEMKCSTSQRVYVG